MIDPFYTSFKDRVKKEFPNITELVVEDKNQNLPRKVYWKVKDSEYLYFVRLSPDSISRPYRKSIREDDIIRQRREGEELWRYLSWSNEGKSTLEINELNQKYYPWEYNTSNINSKLFRLNFPNVCLALGIWLVVFSAFLVYFGK